MDARTASAVFGAFLRTVVHSLDNGVLRDFFCIIYFNQPLNHVCHSCMGRVRGTAPVHPAFGCIPQDLSGMPELYSLERYNSFYDRFLLLTQ